MHMTRKPQNGPISRPPADDPRLHWSSGGQTGRPLGPAPLLRHRRDGILPAVAAALSVRGETLTCTGSKGETPPQLHPLVAEFLDALPVAQRERTTGRCPETILVSRYLADVDGRRSNRAARKPLSQGEARKALKHAKVTARRIREDGDPEHGSYAPPCRSCAPLLAHFGVRAVDPAAERV
ncbi:hypothetical protein SCATT_21100 [Streptantibioticus cattleyicolor NRRL 8057 = DSM 46488]|uniref:Deaminase n=2 Tax=Kitasatosporales TaxID=85011 RepID=G8WZI4_STREN|nr:hypothetical protein SCATT_21100 [Streptantibioticus cattleyicolor NRRL 8057 = DSM 46488]